MSISDSQAMETDDDDEDEDPPPSKMSTSYGQAMATDDDDEDEDPPRSKISSTYSSHDARRHCAFQSSSRLYSQLLVSPKEFPNKAWEGYVMFKAKAPPGQYLCTRCGKTGKNVTLLGIRCFARPSLT
jgi:hypothetical protein